MDMDAKVTDITTQWRGDTLYVTLVGDKWDREPVGWVSNRDVPVGQVQLSRVWNLSHCESDWSTFQAAVPECNGVLVVVATFLEESLRGKGHGVKMYEAAIREAHKRGCAIAPNNCFHPNSTTADAKRVWASISKRFFHVGDIVWGGHVTQSKTASAMTQAEAREIRFNSGNGHHKDHCVACDTIVSQCRCMSRMNCPVYEVICDGCLAKGGMFAKTAKFKSKKNVKTPDGETMVVYEYSDRQIANRNKAKAEQVEKLRKGIKTLMAQVKKDLSSKDDATRLTALAVALMNETFERVGNDTSAKEGHFGVTGWQKKHVSFRGGKARVKYVGKSGVEHDKLVEDASVVTALKEAVKGLSPTDSITGTVGASQVNAYLSKYDITAKDMRGYHANAEMLSRLKDIRSKGGELPEDKKEREKLLKDEFKEALEETAAAVGHSPTMLRNSYLVPGFEEKYLKNGILPTKLNKKGSSVRVTIDEEGTQVARHRFKSFPDLTVAVFDSSAPLYRIIDHYELVQIIHSGRITGGRYAVKAERTFGASWGSNLSNILSWGVRQKEQGRLQGRLYLLKIDAIGRKFAHLDPQIKNGVMDLSKCNTGLGCSLIGIDIYDVDAFYEVGDDESIHPMPLSKLDKS